MTCIGFASRAGDAMNRVTVPFLTQPVTIDGDLSDPAWASAAALTGFVRLESLELARHKTLVYACYDAGHLYFGFQCEGDEISNLQARATERDDYPKEEDRVDLFLDVNHDRETYFYFIVNTLGTTFDMRCESPIAAAWSTEWNPEVSSAARVHPHYWTAELEIPFEGLGVRPPDPGDSWGLNVCRGSYSRMPGGEELSCWTRMRGNFHQPEGFGQAQFARGESPIARLIDLSRTGSEASRVGLEFVNPGPGDTNFTVRLRTKPAGSDPSNLRKRFSVPAGGRREVGIPLGHIKNGRVELDLEVFAKPMSNAVLRSRMDLAHFPDSITGDVTRDPNVAEASRPAWIMPSSAREAPATGHLPRFFIGFWGKPGPNLEKHGIRGSGFNTVIGDTNPDPAELWSLHTLGRGEDYVSRAVEANLDSAAVGGWFLQYETDSRGVHPDELAPYTRLVKSLDSTRPVAIHLSNIGSLENYFPVADLLMVNAMWGGTSVDVVLQVIDEAHRKITEAGKSAGYWFYLWGGRRPAEFRLAAMYALFKGDKGIIFHLGDGAIKYNEKTWSIIRGIEQEAGLLSSLLERSKPAALMEAMEPAPGTPTAGLVPVGPLFIKSFRAQDQDYVSVLNPQPMAMQFRGRTLKKFRSARVLFNETEVAVGGGILEDSIPPYGVKTYQLRNRTKVDDDG